MSFNIPLSVIISVYAMQSRDLKKNPASPKSANPTDPKFQCLPKGFIAIFGQALLKLDSCLA
jgi:hypothetical protein